MIEELGELLEGVGIAVLAAPRMPSCALGLESDEARLVLHRKWVLTGDRHNPETPVHREARQNWMAPSTEATSYDPSVLDQPTMSTIGSSSWLNKTSSARSRWRVVAGRSAVMRQAYA